MIGHKKPQKIEKHLINLKTIHTKTAKSFARHLFRQIKSHSESLIWHKNQNYKIPKALV